MPPAIEHEFGVCSDMDQNFIVELHAFAFAPHNVKVWRAGASAGNDEVAIRSKDHQVVVQRAEESEGFVGADPYRAEQPA